ncbi:hypothetical protein [Eudoraea adriatica]|uniref:hypothetical protein n=1 Tax=Eudoraea adriatica TaxID=446681 RepID=UPI00038179FF|nr:hypothetical protein [Eudoraea adriatica]
MSAKEQGFYKVNWIDGMKINKDHFIAMENSILEVIKHSEQTSITPTNFGLLPELSDQEASLDVNISVDGQSTIEVVLHTCRAITLGGYLINISKETTKLMEQSGYILKQQYSIKKKDKEWYVVLTVNPLKRIAVGNADPEENPPRHPYVFPEYKLDIIPSSETTKQELGLYHLTIAKIIVEDGKPSIDSNFIPPCRSIQSYPDLKFTYNEVGSFLNQMEAFSVYIIQKIHQKKQTNDLANIALYLSEQVVHYLNAYITEYRIIDRYEPPIKMFSKLGGLARVIKSSLDIFVGTGKEDFLNYLTNWCDLNQGALEGVLIETIEMEYVHTDINASLEKISSFTKLMLTLFKKLNELEYIGKKSETGIFVKEEVVDNTEVKSRRSFLLD